MKNRKALNVKKMNANQKIYSLHFWNLKSASYINKRPVAQAQGKNNDKSAQSLV